jgi:class 3 adenylate cyclase
LTLAYSSAFAAKALIPAQEQALVGETPNLAARLQALAEPGTVVIAASTQR